MTDQGRAGDFDAALAELREILSRLDAPDVNLDQAMELFQRGVARLEAARSLLDERRGKVEELIRTSTGAFESVDLDSSNDS